MQSSDLSFVQDNLRMYKTTEVGLVKKLLEQDTNSLNQMLLSISHCSWIVAAASDVLTEIATTLEY